MAYVEKRCEFGSEDLGVEYGGWQMYKWKRNLIQVHPSVRHNFKHKRAKLIIHECRWQEVWKPRGTIHLSSTPSIYYSGPDHWYVKQWFYTLVFEDESVFGDVDGEYYNWSFDLGAVKRKIKRMLGGNKYLTVVHENDFKNSRNYVYDDIVREVLGDSYD